VSSDTPLVANAIEAAVLAAWLVILRRLEPLYRRAREAKGSRGA
jgi:hypothetical protein